MHNVPCKCLAEFQNGCWKDLKAIHWVSDLEKFRLGTVALRTWFALPLRQCPTFSHPRTHTFLSLPSPAHPPRFLSSSESVNHVSCWTWLNMSLNNIENRVWAMNFLKKTHLWLQTQLVDQPTSAASALHWPPSLYWAKETPGQEPPPFESYLAVLLVMSLALGS